MTADHPPNTDLLFEHFATLVTAPDGIARLRELILQLAVQGKLGTQDAGDEPLDEIITKIQKQNQKSTGKKGNYSKIEDSELYFSIPKKWIVLRLGEICSVRAGGTPDRKNSAYWEKGTIPWIKIQDIKEKYVTKTSEYITEEGLKNSSAYLMEPDTLLYTIFATIGKAGILKFKACCNQAIVGIKPNEEIISLEFLYLHLLAIQSYYAQLSRGLAQNNINQTILKNAPIYLPPIAEQHRIVAKVDRLMAICDELEARQQQERAGCLKLGIASLAGLQNAGSPEEFGRQWAQVCDAFDLILDCQDNVAVLRQTILQLAVQGRLVRQEPGDEPARAILKKLQKNSDYSQIDNDEIPYSLPNGWEWERLGTLTKFIDYRGKTPNKILSGIKLITAKNVRMGYLNDEPREYISSEEYDSWMTRGFPSVGDLLFTTEAPMGNVAQISITEKFALAQRVINLHPYEGIFSTYLMYAIMSPLLQTCIEEKSSGVTARGIKAAKLKLIPIPLPPLAEQHRIVTKVDALMALCDALESRLKERAMIQSKFADAVVKLTGAGCCDET